MASISKPRRRRLSKTQRRQRRQQQVRKDRAVRRQLRQLHRQLPCKARGLLDTLGQAFTGPTALRFLLVLCAALLTAGNHTILNALRTLGPLVPGAPSSYHRVFSHRRWSSWRLAKLLAGWVLHHLLPEGPVLLAGDDTVDEHRGRRVYGKGCHRDPVRSTHTYTAFRWGHTWVVLAVLVRFPFTRRLWALPVLVALYCSEEENRRRGRRHKTPPELLGQLLRVLLRWFPQRHFVGAADGNFATPALARLAARHAPRLTYLSHFYANANLYEPPPPSKPGRKGQGRPRKKGPKLPAPRDVVKQTRQRRRLNVAWYGGGRRDVEVVTGTGQWYEAGTALVAVLWVWVHDCTGTHRDEYFFTTDVRWTAAQVIETYTGRWNIETTFAEMRAYLGLETTRGWTEQTVLRVAPCLFGLYTVVAALYAPLPARWTRGIGIAWPGKQDVTFSDAITAVRRWLWVEWVFAIPGHRTTFAKLNRPFQQLLLAGLAPAA
jgi:DDE superfamily endonuclease